MPLIQWIFQNLSIQRLATDDARPIHVRDLKGGDQLRVVMRAGLQLEPSFDYSAASPSRGRRASGYSRTAFYAWVISNDPTNGRMTVNVSDYNPANPPLSATLEYGAIQHLHRIVPRGRPVVETAPATHPGAQALGTKMAQLYPQFYTVPVLFVGH